MLPTEVAVKAPILVVGGDSKLGRALIEHWSERRQPVLATTRRTCCTPNLIALDLASDHWSLPAACHAAVLCAAITSQDACRKSPVSTRKVNVVRTLELARRLMDAGVFVVFISTNLVFDGIRPLRKIDDPLCPKTEYGRQKAEVEVALAQSVAPAAVVRLSKVIERELPLFRNWLDGLRAGQPVQAFSNYGCSPAPADLAVGTIARIAELRAGGIWQLSAKDDISYEDIARHFARRLRQDPSLVQPVLGDLQALEHVPQYTSLDSTKTGTILERPIPDSRLALDQVFFAQPGAHQQIER